MLMMAAAASKLKHARGVATLRAEPHASGAPII